MLFQPFKSFLFSLLLPSLLLTPSLYSKNVQPLQVKEIHNVINQMFRQHVEEREMSGKIIRRAIKTYLNQFDPNKIYLLNSEIEQFTEVSDQELEQYVDQYYRADYTLFEQLNDLVQQSIFRARSIRSEVELQLHSLVLEIERAEQNGESLLDEPLEKTSYANSIEELKNLNRKRFIQFLALQREHTGKKVFKKKQHKAQTLYERQLRDLERDYLYETERGRMITDEKQEDLFTYHVIKALAKSLDSHTTFYNPEEAYEMRVRLEKGFHGIGVVLQEGIDGIIVVRLIEGGPAMQSGQIEEQDRLVEINGTSIVDMPFRKALEMIRGKEGSMIYLGFRRLIKDENDQEIDELVHVELRRGKVIINEKRVDISHERFGDGIIGKLTLHSFYDGADGISSERDMRDALNQLYQEGKVKGLILDLRENSGGFLIQAVKVAGLFISNGVVVTSKYSNGTEKVFRDIDGHTYFNGPLVVLISKASASAAEIVAQALQDYGVAVIVGDDQSYGKGSIQHQTVTGDQGAVSLFKVTVGKFYTVSGLSTQIRGVKSDIWVPTDYHDDELGELYLDYPLENDQIDNFYADNLSDIDRDVKQWYTKYYLPSLQRRTLFWKSMLPILKQNSAYRMKENKNYQLFLSEMGVEVEKDEEEEEENPYAQKKEKNFGVEDLQMTEAVNIVKDMIFLQSTGVHLVNSEP